jgi:hypothetical protein
MAGGAQTVCCNTVIGSYAAQRLSGGANTVIGFRALTTATGATCGNTVIGNKAMYCAGGQGNVAIGNYALSNCCSASSSNNTGGCNTVVGFGAACGACLGSQNVIDGVCAMALATQSPACNVSIGAFSSLNFQTGNCNVMIGVNAFRCMGTGINNVAIGALALAGSGSNCAGSTIGYNIAIGNKALYKTISGCNNVAIGASAMCANVTGNCSIAIGRNALCSANSVTGCNIAIGDNAGSAHTGYNAIMIGAGSAGAAAGCANFISLGNASMNCFRAPTATITAISDCRDKTNIQGIPIGLDFIKQVRPVRFTWNMRDGNRPRTEDAGFIAQELNDVVQQYNANWLKLVSTENSDRFEASPAQLLPVVVKAIQELEEKFAALTTRVNTLEQNL